MTATRTLESHELDAVAGGSVLSGNTANVFSGNGGSTGGVLALNVIGGKQFNNVSTGNANGAAGGSGSMINSGSIKFFGGFIGYPA